MNRLYTTINKLFTIINQFYVIISNLYTIINKLFIKNGIFVNNFKNGSEVTWKLKSRIFLYQVQFKIAKNYWPIQNINKNKKIKY